MECKICNSHDVDVIYNGKIRDGAVDNFTKENVPIYRCQNCGVIWHDNVLSDIDNFYESEEYRDNVDGGSEASRFYELHDVVIGDNFRYTGTKMFRDKVVADIGCAAGAWLDFLKGVAKEVVGIEPSKTFRNIMESKRGGGGITTFPYADRAKTVYHDRVDVVTSFDVIEHVESPEKFLKDAYDLLVSGGIAVIGTPTDTPVTGALVGDDYNKVILYTAQHLWILSKKSLELMAERVGFSKCEIKYFQRFSITNLFAWLQYRRPLSIGVSHYPSQERAEYNFVSKTLEAVYKSELERQGLADYMVAYLYK